MKINSIYVASSWKNPLQSVAVNRLREAGFDVYDFHGPPSQIKFHWLEIDEDHSYWDNNEYLTALHHPSAEAAFQANLAAMQKADWCVLVLPAGRSAHMIAGYFYGHPGKNLVILLEDHPDPAELMYKMAEVFCVDLDQLVEFFCDEEARTLA